MISVKGEADNVAQGPISMEEKNHQSASRSTKESSPASSVTLRQNLIDGVGQAASKSTLPNGSESQEIILDANFFMNGT